MKERYNVLLTLSAVVLLIPNWLVTAISEIKFYRHDDYDESQFYGPVKELAASYPKGCKKLSSANGPFWPETDEPLNNRISSLKVKLDKGEYLILGDTSQCGGHIGSKYEYRDGLWMLVCGHPKENTFLGVPKLYTNEVDLLTENFKPFDDRMLRNRVSSYMISDIKYTKATQKHSICRHVYRKAVVCTRTFGCFLHPNHPYIEAFDVAPNMNFIKRDGGINDDSNQEESIAEESNDYSLVGDGFKVWKDLSMIPKAIKKFESTVDAKKLMAIYNDYKSEMK